MGKLCQIFQNGSYHYYERDYLGSTRAVLAEDGTLLQDANYYPGGLSFSQLNDTEETDRLHCGKELDKISGLDWYDFSARHLDPAYCRFTTPDPLAEQYPDLSPYAYCMGNPIKFIDPTGMEFSETAEKYATILQMYATALLYINNLLGNNFLNENAVTELTQVVDEINTLRESNQLYDVAFDSSLKVAGFNTGQTLYAPNQNAVLMVFDSDQIDYALVAHEFKHAFQFETGEMSLSDGVNAIRSYFLYDQTDEIVAYNRGAIFSDSQYSLEPYNKLSDDDITIHSHRTLCRILRLYQNNTRELEGVLVDFATRYPYTAFRINGKTYYYAPK